jgi:hypothetical protein
MSTKRVARWTFVVLAVFITLMAAWHVWLGLRADGTGGAAWPHYLLGALYTVGALGLVLRPRGFVVFFGLLTIYAVGASVIGAWRAVRGPASFSMELALGFVIFPLALNLLLADTIHERTREISRAA